MTQPDLFAPPAPPKLCGTCVTRNAAESDEHGDCARMGRRHKDDAPCEAWFGLEELRRPLYGRQGKSR